MILGTSKNLIHNNWPQPFCTISIVEHILTAIQTIAGRLSRRTDKVPRRNRRRTDKLPGQIYRRTDKLPGHFRGHLAESLLNMLILSICVAGSSRRTFQKSYHIFPFLLSYHIRPPVPDSFQALGDASAARHCLLSGALGQSLGLLELPGGDVALVELVQLPVGTSLGLHAMLVIGTVQYALAQKLTSG